MEMRVARYSLFATHHSPILLLHHRAGRVGRTEGLLAGDFGYDLVIVPRIFRLLRLLDLDQHEVVNHQIVLAQFTVASEEILDRLFAHLRRDLERIVGAAVLDGVEIIHDRGIDAGLPHRRHPVHLGEIAFRPFAGLVVHVPVERRRQQQYLRRLKPERMNIGDQRQQRRHLLAALEDAELAGGLDLVDVVGGAGGDADDLRFGGLRLQYEGGHVGRRQRQPHRSQHLAAIGGDDAGRVAFQRVAERVVVGDEEPAIAATLDHRLSGADRERAGVDHPLHCIGRAELAVEIRREGGVRDEQLLLFIGDGLYRQPDCRDRYVDDQVDLFGVVPAPGNAGADIGLQLVVADDDADRLAQHLAAEIVDRHLRRGDRTLAGGRRRRSVHTGENADFNNVIRYLRQRGWG